MKTCEGCGAFYNQKCDYCGHIDLEWKEEDKIEFSTLKIDGNMNKINIDYGNPLKNNEILNGNMQKIKIKAKFINIIMNGNMNKVKVDKKVKYTSVVNGNMNKIE